MRIGMILQGNFPPDIRVEKEILSLLKQHELFLLCEKREDQPWLDLWKEVKITRVMSRRQRMASIISLMISQHSGEWVRNIRRFIIENNLDAIHVHDLPLIGTALNVARECGVPIVADLHENYPAMLELSVKAPFLPFSSLGVLAQKLLISVKAWKKYEKEILPHTDVVISVIEEASDRLRELGVSERKLFTIPNYNMSADEIDISVTIMDSSVAREKMIYLYTGGVGFTRDLLTLIDAVALLDKVKYQNLEVIILGATRKAFSRLVNYTVQKKVSDRVKILQWLPRHEAEAMMLRATIGLVPHVKSEHTDTTIPHKLFQYMGRGLPVIVSNCRPLERIVLESRCGLVYQSGNSVSLSKCLAVLYQNESAISLMRNAGIKSIQKRYDWRFAEEKLLKLYADLPKKIY